ncbi:voltage-gated potassium channel [Meredithblackwellia eburnea MCA 4105]
MSPSSRGQQPFHDHHHDHSHNPDNWDDQDQDQDQDQESQEEPIPQQQDSSNNQDLQDLQLEPTNQQRQEIHSASISSILNSLSIHHPHNDDDDDHDHDHGRWWSNTKRLFNSIHDQSKFLPLLAAVAAPLSTLLDIPALSQKWYLLNNSPIPDPRACIVLSSISLTLNLLANVLLVTRFTAGERHWRIASAASTVCWCLKLAVAIVNLSLFGASTRNDHRFTYSEGFWCAVGSCTISGLITLSLLLHFLLRFDHPSTPDSHRIRLVGAEFIVAVGLFVGLVAVEALVFSRLERWQFFDGIYFALITVLTIGFGDLTPTTPVSRILLFPFSLLSIALLAILVGIFVDFLGKAAEVRRKDWRRRYERDVWEKRFVGGGGGGRGRGMKGGKRVNEAGVVERPKFLKEEIEMLHLLEDKEDFLERVYQMCMSAFMLAVFWVVGAAVFHVLEDMTFGTALYFCYVFFLTIGYGDLSPKTAGGRVFFVIYALIAVPFVTNFVLNTVSSMMNTLTKRRFRKFRLRHLVKFFPHASHAHNVHESHLRLGEFMDGEGDGEGGDRDGDGDGDARPETTSDWEKKYSRDREMLKVVLGLAVQMEEEATLLLLDSLSSTGKGHYLLQADRNLQMRALTTLNLEPRYHGYITLALKAVGKRTPPDGVGVGVARGDSFEPRYDLSPEEALQLSRVQRYRESFAGLVAAGSRLMGLEGDERMWFERRLDSQCLHDPGNDDDDDDGNNGNDGDSRGREEEGRPPVRRREVAKAKVESSPSRTL